ncbi:hypothetical protein WR25_15407 [Diploscapter pachys]|uniref:glucuronosyltransferase n=1 Tax=Diploscapter pachys TaxID=2018661 RepID=A0A2A2LN47_9BILA|nr:hypothetical protein WR25_15407 [Diploscapter pachys]
MSKLMAGQLESVFVVDYFVNTTKSSNQSLVDQKSNLVLWSQTTMRPESAWANQSPSPPSYLPAPKTGYTDEMTFFERCVNVAYYLREIFIHQRILQPHYIDHMFKHYFSDAPSSFDIERNASLNLINNPPIFDFPRAYMPRVNYVGCLQCREAQPLTKEFAAFVDKASEDHGFIVISSGFTAEWSVAPEHIKKAFLDTFRFHSKIKFIWQYNELPIGVPTNVLAKEWLPLQDLLGHSKCVAHISHGGLNSVMESIYHGVPIIGIPLIASAYDNLLRVQSRDAGIIVTKYQLREGHLSKAIQDILSPKYKEAMLEFQDLVRDVPVSSLNMAAFWLEFIDRHKEIPHARSGADKLNILQYFLVDIIAFLLSSLILLLLIVIFIVKRTIRLILFLLRPITSRIFNRSAKPEIKKKTD